MSVACRVVFLALVALVAAGGAAAGARAQDASAVDPMPEARDRLARGEGLYDTGDFAGALAEFRALDRLLEGHPLRPLAVWNMARAAERLFRYDEAVALYERYVASPEPEARYLEAAREKLATLATLLGTLEIEVRLEPPSSSSVEVWIDEHVLEGSHERVRVPGGRHVVEARAAARLPVRREVELVAGRSEHVLLVLRPASRGLEPTPFWVSVTAAAIGLVGVAVLGPLALAERDGIAACTATLECQSRRGWTDPISGGATAAFQDVSSRLSALTISADVSLGLAAAGAISALVLGLLTDFSGRPTDASLALLAGPERVGLAWGASW